MPDGGNSPEGAQFSRRSFLKRASQVGMAAFGAKFLGPKVADQLVETVLTADQKLAKLGFSEYIPYYHAITAVEEQYHHTPKYDASLFTAPMTILRGIVNNQSFIPIEGSDLLKNGWGEKKSYALQDAKEKVASMEINVSPGIPDTPENARQEMQLLADLFPLQVLMTPKKLSIVGGGGGYTGSEISIESPAHDREGFFRSAMHEMSHAEGRWQSIRPYIDKTSYFSYVTYEADQIKNILDTYFALPWEQARVFKSKTPLVLRYPGDYNKNQCEYVEADFAKRFAVDLNTTTPLSENDMQDESIRLNRLIWYVGNHANAIRDKKLQKIPISKQDNDFLEDYHVHELLARAAGEVDHYIRGPVQTNTLRLPSTKTLSLIDDDFMTQTTKQIELARLRTFSTLNPQETTDFGIAADAIRGRLNLPQP